MYSVARMTIPRGTLVREGYLAEIVNLNRFRKARQRVEDSQHAAENRARFGRTKAEKARDRHEAEKTTQDHAGKELAGRGPAGKEPADRVQDSESEEPA